MTKKPEPAASETSFPFDFTKAMSDLEPARMMEQYAEALNKIGLPSVDMKAVLASAKKNVESLSAANKQAVEGYQAVLTRQGEMLRETLGEATTALKDLTTVSSPKDATAKQAELLSQAMEKALTNMRDLADMVTKANTEVFETVRDRMVANLAEIKEMAQKGT